MEPTFTRVAKDQTTVELSFNKAVDQFITDNYTYATADGTIDPSEISLDEFVNDMSSVFEARSMLEALEPGEELTSGISTFIRN